MAKFGSKVELRRDNKGILGKSIIFLLVLEAPNGRGYLVNAVLGAKDRFAEMEKLIGWVKQSYQW